MFLLNHPATPELYPLSPHDALPISTCPFLRASSRFLGVAFSVLECPPPPAIRPPSASGGHRSRRPRARSTASRPGTAASRRSEEHTSELQSRQYLVCRLLLEKTNSY